MRTLQLREAKATLSALVEEAAHGEPAVIVGIDEWNRLREVPSFGPLLAAAPLEEGDLPPRDMSPPRNLAG